MRVFRDGRRIDLSAQDFVGAGGEGAVYARAGVAYKIYHDAGRVIPAGKLRELARIADARVVRPDCLLTDGDGRPVGYAARFVGEAWVLCQLFPRAFRERNGLSHEAVARLVAHLREAVDAVHGAGVLVADLNEMNVLVARHFDDVFLIDADSWQTPGHPATAVMPSVRDWTAPPGTFTEGSDWFSFGVVSFQMFTGIHPYKGRHPRVAGLEERMRAGISVFRPEVRVPAAAYPLDVIPRRLREWYEAVFERGVRCPPPGDAGPAAFAPTVAAPPPDGIHLEVRLLRRYDGPIVGVWVRPTDGTPVVVTDASVWVGDRRVAPAPTGVRACGFGLRGGRPVLVSWDGCAPRLLDLERLDEVPFALEAQEVAGSEGRVYLRAGGIVHEMILHETGDQVVASVREAARVLEHATRLHPGVVVQQLPGATYVSLLVGPGEARQLRLPELEGRRVVDARHERGVLAAVAEAGGRYDRLVMRFDPADWSYDLRVAQDVGPAGVNLAVLDRGVCLCIAEDDRLEVFGARKGSTAFRVIEDPAVGGDMRLCGGGGAIVARGEDLSRLGMRGGGAEGARRGGDT